jgi:hypothetical protein
LSWPELSEFGGWSAIAGAAASSRDVPIRAPTISDRTIFLAMPVLLIVKGQQRLPL